MHLFYEGLGVKKSLGDMTIVSGPHNMGKSKRGPAYEWLNKWFDKEAEGKSEPPLQTEKEEDLWCTESGFTLISLGGETGQTINAKRAQNIYKPQKDIAALKQRVAQRIGLATSQGYGAPVTKSVGVFESENFTAEKFLYKTEEGRDQLKIEEGDTHNHGGCGCKED